MRLVWKWSERKRKRENDLDPVMVRISEKRCCGNQLRHSKAAGVSNISILELFSYFSRYFDCKAPVLALRGVVGGVPTILWKVLTCGAFHMNLWKFHETSIHCDCGYEIADEMFWKCRRGWSLVTSFSSVAVSWFMRISVKLMRRLSRNELVHMKAKLMFYKWAWACCVAHNLVHLAKGAGRETSQTFWRDVQASGTVRSNIF